MMTLARPLHGAAAPEAADAATWGPAVLWGLLAAKVIGSWGVLWDIQWHVLIGRDSFWIAPHLMTYAGVTLAVVLSFGALAWQTRTRAHPAGHVRVLGLTGSRGFHLAAWGMAVTVLAAPIDDFWHRLFGLDVTLWSPPHLMGLFGSIVNSLACLVVAAEVYPAGHRARPVAMALAGATAYGGLQLAVDPSFRIAYLYGGVRFYTFAVLSALLLPPALIAAARVSGMRSAPVWVILAAVAIGVVGHRVADAGFAWLQPVSVIEEEIAKDPTSPIAIATIMARKSGTRPGQTGGLRHLVALVPAVAMAAMDARRRPVAATVLWALLLFAFGSWRLAHLAALAPMAPGLVETGVALVLTALAALAGGRLGRGVASALSPR